MDLITCDKFFSDRLRYVDFVGGFPLTMLMAVNTGLARLRRLRYDLTSDFVRHTECN